MKVTRRIQSLVADFGVMVVLAACATTLSAGEEHQGYAKVKYVVGNPTFTRGTGAAQPVNRYMVLRPGDVISTDGSSHVDLLLGYNNGSIQVPPSSVVALSKLTYQVSFLETTHDTQLDLRKGAIYGKVNKMSAGSKYEVKSPKGVAGIRGTAYGVRDNGDVMVPNGRAVMALMMPDGSAKPFDITTGNMLDAKVPVVRKLSKSERDMVNESVADSMTHGDIVRDTTLLDQGNQYPVDGRDVEAAQLGPKEQIVTPPPPISQFFPRR